MMSQSFHDAGLKLAANIKPCLLQDHPRYGEVAERGLFIRDSQTTLRSVPASGMMKGRISISPIRKPWHGGRKA